MITDSDYLIVYGTLRPAFDNAAARYLRQYSRYVGEVSFPGQLFDLGNYPGAVYQDESPLHVCGSLYNIEQYKKKLLTYLDEYEGIGSQYEQPYEYTRTTISVLWMGRSLDCWIYLYNLSDKEKHIIKSGDYVRYVGQ